LELPPSSMGFMLPSSDSPAEKARALIARRTVLEAELDEQLSVLRSNGVDSRSPLVDADGFPRADIDVWAVRHARVRAIELRNDLVTLTNEIGAALTAVYDPALRSQSEEGSSERKEEPDASAFAKVDGVLSGSPAAAAVRQHLSSNAVRTHAWICSGSSNRRPGTQIRSSYTISYDIKLATSRGSCGGERERMWSYYFFPFVY
jgi:hypothetical protein